MKKALLLSVSFVILMASQAVSQTNFCNNHYMDPYNPAYEQGEIIVKFKDEIDITFDYKSNIPKCGFASIDNFINSNGVTEVDKVFKTAKKDPGKRTYIDHTGKEKEVPQLFNIYLFKHDKAIDAKESAKIINEYPLVEYAEPNYLLYTMGNRDTTPNDPLYPNQWYLEAINAPAAWDTVTGDTTQVIAIIDTGVDWDHPDLDDNIWRNWDEIPDNGIDDDGNGYVDDIRGWDFVNNDNDPDDKNSHGTHVAGIAAAEGNNETGITGIAWNSKILPIKALDAGGYGVVSDLCESINYANQMNVSVINMSLGTYSESITLKNTIINSYINGIFSIAAAGNEGKDIEETYDPVKPLFPEYPMFPAAWPIVIGVQTTNNWSNFDQSGPFTSKYNEDTFFNYEVTAPGENIHSTIPNGFYHSYSGTSMAAPMVAAAIVLLKSLYPQSDIWTITLRIAMHNNQLNLFDLIYFEAPLCDPSIFSHVLIDTIGDNDGKADPLETISIDITAINKGGGASNLWSKLSLNQYEDTADVNILADSVWFGSISPCARKQAINAFSFKIGEQVEQNQVLKFDIKFYDGSNLLKIETFEVLCENVFNLTGICDSLLVLTPDRNWVINSPFKLSGQNAKLIIKPGTKLFCDGYDIILQDGATIYARGTKDSLVEISRDIAEYTYFRVLDSLMFVHVSGYYQLENFKYISNCIIDIQKGLYIWNNVNAKIINSEIYAQAISGPNIEITNCNLFLHKSGTSSPPWIVGESINNCRIESFSNYSPNDPINFAGSSNCIINFPSIIVSGKNNLYFSCDGNRLIYNNYSNNNICVNGARSISSLPGSYIEFQNQYFGTTNNNLIDEMIYDFYEDPNLAIINYHPAITFPPDSLPPFVHELLIDGINPLDDFKEPLGFGIHRFDVIFNKPMDTSFTPLLTFGVIAPYIQRVVRDSSFWSQDNTIWTAFNTFNMKTGDGLNRMRISSARDTSGMEIPVEVERFEILIDVAGTASAGFFAIPGIGKVSLEWPFPDQTDLLGFNMYRSLKMDSINWSSFIRINDALILDSTYHDYNVIPDSTYKYYYEIITTDFNASDPSNEVIATPFSAPNGDANGDMAVNVLDITTIVSYMLNQNPQPFLFDAADVNGDDQINVLDIIGTVQIIMGTKSAPLSQLVNVNPEPAFIKLKDNTLELESKGQVAAIQFNLTCVHPDQIKLLCKIPGFEMATGITRENTITGILYNFTQKEIPGGLTDLIQIESDQNQEITIGEVTGGDLNGDYVPILKDGEAIKLPETFSLLAQPNPFCSETQIKFDLPEAARVQAEIFDISGKKITTLINRNLIPGSHTINWNSRDNQGRVLPSGIYFLHFEANSENESIVKDIKLIYMK
jgi:subtilisin family serine protease